MYFVYILKLKNSSIYSGITDDIITRVKKHNEGGVISTKQYRPVKLIWYCCFSNKNRAVEFEKYLKKGSGQAFRNKHLVP